MTIITPYLPKMAEMAIKDHPRPCFIRAVELDDRYTGYCRNCAGLGVVLISFSDSGPFHDIPTTRKPITFFDGDGQTGKGWYILGKTEEFTCPHCKGISRTYAAPAKEQVDGERAYSRPTKIGALMP